jgi:DNA modification methylase
MNILYSLKLEQLITLILASGVQRSVIIRIKEHNITGVVLKSLGRKYIGIEKDKDFLDLSVRRIGNVK